VEPDDRSALTAEDDVADGIYTMTFRGAADWGMGILVLRRGEVTGADMGGCLYDGRYRDDPDNLILELKMTVPAGGTLVQGTPPQTSPYVVPFNASVPKQSIETSAPFLVHLPPGPVNVIVRCLRKLDE
jgi:hypothetical protein